MQVINEGGTILIFANTYDAAILAIIQESEKAIKVQNKESNLICWIPKSGIQQRKPGVATYENEYVVKNWFWAKMNLQQQKVLNISE